MRILAAILATMAISVAGTGLAAAEDDGASTPTATIETGDSPREVGTAPEGAADPAEPTAPPESASEPIEPTAAPEGAGEPRSDPETVTAEEAIAAFTEDGAE
ncbi:hypothetical protein [Tsukamurella pseudospumae]|uniref:Uncharacterized protein n=1 Tax=Tsukamurella pseudospumae TaxID=239498 RepID=A0A137YUG5_9ACTN|nr:hypothetical protein [Tsukamurella pseudospumae]KXO89463.1 hypothetical protein AXK61_08410 [Tsukamurella pseudospumae]